MLSTLHVLVLILPSLFQICVTQQTKCNGLADLCRLRVDQATYPGSHNAGAGFDGIMEYWSGIQAASCWYRNHKKSFSEQLEYGIRYFDIDTCYDDRTGHEEALNCHCPDETGTYCAYSGSIEKGLKQIDNWLKHNPNEVIFIHFNRDAQVKFRKEIAASIVKTLLKLWGPSSSGGLKMSDYYRVHRSWPTLQQAISSNKRIFIFMDDNLFKTITAYYSWLLSRNYMIATTWDTIALSSSCSGITTNAKKKCQVANTFVELSAFGSKGLCTWDMAVICSKWLGEAQDACFDKRKAYHKTVNFLSVDWLDYHKGSESVVNKAKFMNQKNIKEYLGKDIFFPELQGCSYNSKWVYNYCWKYCPEYGWCWSDKYCGKDASVCKRQSYSCHEKCGYS